MYVALHGPDVAVANREPSLRMQTPGSSGEPATELSIVVPMYNEEGNVDPLVKKVEAEARRSSVQAELILVDDGSTDGSLRAAEGLRAGRPWLRVLHHPRSMGQSAAMGAGIAAAKGEFVATLDADLQNDPADLPRLLTMLRENGADMAQGCRARREDSAVRKFSSWVGRTTRRQLLGDTVRDTGCSTRVVRATVAKRFPLQYKGLHRFLPVYAKMLGATVIETPVAHHPRRWGRSKYGVGNRALSGLRDCLAVRWMRNRLRNAEYQEMPQKTEDPMLQRA